MGDGMSHNPPPPPPPPPPPAVVFEAQPIFETGDSASGAVPLPATVRPDRRADGDPVATGLPSEGGVIGSCSVCAQQQGG
jgi:hypothetical protein